MQRYFNVGDIWTNSKLLIILEVLIRLDAIPRIKDRIEFVPSLSRVNVLSAKIFDIVDCIKKKLLRSPNGKKVDILWHEGNRAWNAIQVPDSATIEKCFKLGRTIAQGLTH
jgi:hypothetical protein